MLRSDTTNESTICISFCSSRDTSRRFFFLHDNGISSEFNAWMCIIALYLYAPVLFFFIQKQSINSRACGNTRRHWQQASLSDRLPQRNVCGPSCILTKKKRPLQCFLNDQKTLFMNLENALLVSHKWQSCWNIPTVRRAIVSMKRLLHVVAVMLLEILLRNGQNKPRSPRDQMQRASSHCLFVSTSRPCFVA